MVQQESHPATHVCLVLHCWDFNSPNIGLVGIEKTPPKKGKNKGGKGI